VRWNGWDIFVRDCREAEIVSGPPPDIDKPFQGCGCKGTDIIRPGLCRCNATITNPILPAFAGSGVVFLEHVENNKYHNHPHTINAVSLYWEGPEPDPPDPFNWTDSEDDDEDDDQDTRP
jgi:hypothetical protein